MYDCRLVVELSTRYTAADIMLEIYKQYEFDGGWNKRGQTARRTYVCKWWRPSVETWNHETTRHSWNSRWSTSWRAAGETRRADQTPSSRHRLEPVETTSAAWRWRLGVSGGMEDFPADQTWRDGTSADQRAGDVHLIEQLRIGLLKGVHGLLSTQLHTAHNFTLPSPTRV